MISDSVETEERQVAYFEEAMSRYQQAAAVTPPQIVYLMVADIRIDCECLSPTLLDLILPAFSSLVCDGSQDADCVLRLWDSEASDVDMLPPPCSRSRFTDRGDIWGFNSERIRLAFIYGEYSVSLFDMQSGTGVYWLPHTKKYPYWAKASPLRQLLHWCMERSGRQLLHAAAIGDENQAVLLTGKGGIGKSTTALQCLLNGMHYLGDDYVVVSQAPEPRVFPLYATAKLNPDQVAAFPDLSHIQTHDPKTDEKAVYQLYPTFQNRMPSSLPLSAILIPQITNEARSAITERVTKNEVRHHASFTTVSQLSRAGKYTYAFIHELVEAIPAFQLDLGSDSKQLVDVIRAACKSPPPQQIERSNGRDPLLSVIIPVYNRQHFIREAIENVMAQQITELELIIIDDGSTDQTVAVIDSLPYDIRLYRQPNEGPAAARNRGILNATGERIAFLDSDDLWVDGTLQLLMNELTKDPKLLAAKGHSQFAKFDAKAKAYVYEGNPLECYPFSFPGSVFRADAFKQVGLLDSELQFGEDTDWFQRAKEMNLPIKWLPITSLIVRRHQTNMTSGKDDTELGAIRIFKKSLDRKRHSEHADDQARNANTFHETPKRTEDTDAD